MAKNSTIMVHTEKVKLGAKGGISYAQMVHTTSGRSTLPVPGPSATASELFDYFCTATTLSTVMSGFNRLCDLLDLNPAVESRYFYRALRKQLWSHWKAQSFFAKLDKRVLMKEYKKQNVCASIRALVIGAGPCGLRCAIELALLGAKVVVVEKRDMLSRNNVLHLWPFLIHDLKSLGAKMFFGKFCAGSIDHINIRTLQLILVKIALVFGVQLFPGVEFQGVLDPEMKDETGEAGIIGWRAQIVPGDHILSSYEFDVLIGADGKRNTLDGFRRREFRGKLAIAITANFVNYHSQAEAHVEEISGVAYIFNQQFFKQLKANTGIDLENIVYYKDETHYFVMTAKKSSLLTKEVLRRDLEDPAALLHRSNINYAALLAYAKEAANVSTNHRLPALEFAVNGQGHPDVALFDFTSLHQAENSCRAVERLGKKLFVGLVGDSLLEPFWPTGSGCARGFLGAMDIAWSVRRLAARRNNILDVIAERESVYQRLSQTSPENMYKQFAQYTIDPRTRYPTMDMQYFQAHHVQHLFSTDDPNFEAPPLPLPSEPRHKRLVSFDKSLDASSLPRFSLGHLPPSPVSPLAPKAGSCHMTSHGLLRWFQIKLDRYADHVMVNDLVKSWVDGVALLCLVHLYKPDLIKVDTVLKENALENLQLAFALFERDFGVHRVLSAEEVLTSPSLDPLPMLCYLEEVYNALRGLLPHRDGDVPLTTSTPGLPAPARAFKGFHLPHSYRRSYDLAQPRDSAAKKRRTGNGERQSKLADSIQAQTNDTPIQLRKVTLIPSQTPASKKITALQQKLFGGSQENLAPVPTPSKRIGAIEYLSTKKVSETCYFCRGRVYLVERQSAEGLFFHRECLKCQHCGTHLRLNNYALQRGLRGESLFYCMNHIGLSAVDGLRRPSKPGRLSQDNSIPASGNWSNHYADPEAPVVPPRVESLCSNTRARLQRSRALRTSGSFDSLLPDPQEVRRRSDSAPISKVEGRRGLESSVILDVPLPESWGFEDERSKEDADWRDLDGNHLSWENAVAKARVIRVSLKTGLDKIGRSFSEDSCPKFSPTSSNLSSPIHDRLPNRITSLASPESENDPDARETYSDSRYLSEQNVAKQRYFEEPTKPLRIDVKDFVLQSNCNNVTVVELADPTEEIGYLPHLDITSPKRIVEPPNLHPRAIFTRVLTRSDSEEQRHHSMNPKSPPPLPTTSPPLLTSGFDFFMTPNGLSSQPTPDTRESAFRLSSSNDLRHPDTYSLHLTDSPREEDWTKPKKTLGLVPENLSADVPHDGVYDAEKGRKKLIPLLPFDSLLRDVAEMKEVSPSDTVENPIYMCPHTDLVVGLSRVYFADLESDTSEVGNDMPSEDTVDAAVASQSHSTEELDSFPSHGGKKKSPKKGILKSVSPKKSSKKKKEKSPQLSSSPSEVIIKPKGEKKKQLFKIFKSSSKSSSSPEKDMSSKEKKKQKKEKKKAERKCSKIRSMTDASEKSIEESPEKELSYPDTTVSHSDASSSEDNLDDYMEETIPPEERIRIHRERKAASAVARQRRAKELVRLRQAQELQRQLQEVEVRLAELETQGVAVEKRLREFDDEKDGSTVSSRLQEELLVVVGEKNELVRLEGELVIRAKELELEDRQDRLEEEFRRRLAMDETRKTPKEKDDDKKVLEEYIHVVEERDSLVKYLEEQRQRELHEDAEVLEMMGRRGIQQIPMTHAERIRYGSTQESHLI